MAQGDKKKKSNGGGAKVDVAKKASNQKEEAVQKGTAATGDNPKKAAEGKAVPATAARVEEHGGEHAHAAGGHHQVNRREYFVVFGVLFALTVLEVVVAKLPGVGRTAIGVALVSLALTKAATVALFYMHLKHETRILRTAVAIPLAAPTLYAFVLIADAAWRLTR